MGEEVTKYFRAQELMNPNLEPCFTFEVNVAEEVPDFPRVKGSFGAT
jgi:hypothetical protein